MKPDHTPLTLFLTVVFVTLCLGATAIWTYVLPV